MGRQKDSAIYRFKKMVFINLVIFSNFLDILGLFQGWPVLKQCFKTRQKNVLKHGNERKTL